MPKKEFSRLVKNVRLLVFDFDGVFTDNRVLVLQDGREGVFCNRADGLGIVRLKQTGIKLRVISTETNPVVKARCKKLNLVCVQGCKSKLEVLKQEAGSLGIPLNKTAYVGNDVNDLECLQAVLLPIGVADSHPAIRKSLKYITKNKGGAGAVRELCELILQAKGHFIA